MTCGGLVFIVALLIGATWLGDQLGSSWPLWAASILILALIGWRVFEYAAQRRMAREFDHTMDTAVRTGLSRAASRTVLSEHRRQVDGGRWANFLFVKYPDGSREWVVEYDTPLLPDARERASERWIVEELHADWRRKQG